MAAHLNRSDYEAANAVDGTDGRLRWNDSEEDRDVRRECGEDEGTDCKDGESDTDWYKHIKSKQTLCFLSVSN